MSTPDYSQIFVTCEAILKHKNNTQMHILTPHIIKLRKYTSFPD